MKKLIIFLLFISCCQATFTSTAQETKTLQRHLDESLKIIDETSILTNSIKTSIDRFGSKAEDKLGSMDNSFDRLKALIQQRKEQRKK